MFTILPLQPSIYIYIIYSHIESFLVGVSQRQSYPVFFVLQERSKSKWICQVSIP